MFKNYFRIAFRSLVKNRIFSLINIFGLSIGLTAFLMIVSYVFDELNFDKYAADAGQIYRLGLHVTGNGSVDDYPHVDGGVGPGMARELPEIRTYTRMASFFGDIYLKYGTKQFKENKLTYTDSNFFEIFTVPFLLGDPKTALTQPGSLVITKEFAKKYFGADNPMGKAIIFPRGNYKVTGVIDRIPSNSHFHFDAFISMSTIRGIDSTWSNVGFYTYLVLNKNADPKKLEAKFPALVARYVVPEIQHDMGVGLAEAQKSVNTFRFYLQPLKEIHLYSNTKYELEANGDIRYVYVFSALAVFILLLACVNFTNLSTARSSKRAKEIGVRKVMGSLRAQLVSQFMAESILVSFLALILAGFFSYLLLPFFNQISGKQFQLSSLLNVGNILFMIAVTSLVGICAGIYPAFFLSSFNPINVLKGPAFSPKSQGRNGLRSGLVIFQFFVSTALIIATIVVYQQLHFMQAKKLGYDKDEVVYLQDTYLIGTRDVRKAFRESLSQDPRVINATITSDVPGNSFTDGTQIYPKEKEAHENDFEIHTNIYHIDYDYISTLGMKISRGRNFSKDFPSDSTATVINEAAVRELGWTHTDPIGKTIVTSGRHEYTVVGVVEDFHYTTVKHRIDPLMMRLDRPGPGLLIKVKSANMRQFLADLEGKWKGFNREAPFSYYFLNDHFANVYRSEERTGKLFSMFAIISILIACLGLFGLAAFSTEQRTKEIGIRKVLGASVQQVLVLVTREFLLLIGIAFLIAIPFCWWLMNVWLREFAYRIHVQWWIFGLAGALSIVIAILTISFRAISAALANPVKSLRTE
jgi:putative ABC transport system permease protein